MPLGQQLLNASPSSVCSLLAIRPLQVAQHRLGQIAAPAAAAHHHGAAQRHGAALSPVAVWAAQGFEVLVLWHCGKLTAVVEG